MHRTELKEWMREHLFYEWQMLHHALSRAAALQEANLAESFEDYQLAVNVLKHGKGRSYEALLKKAQRLPFRIKLLTEKFSEGDVSEISTLIDVDDAFVRQCAEIIEQVYKALRKYKYGF